MCVGCRAKEPRSILLRIVAVDGFAKPDPERRLPGRGANVHRSQVCIGQAIRRKSLLRALRVSQLDTTELEAWSAGSEERPPVATGAYPSRVREHVE
jgi:predicted RNA-binding protein YlxR (DUF448 family)